jgi:hypothetical protein
VSAQKIQKKNPNGNTPDVDKSTIGI